MNWYQLYKKAMPLPVTLPVEVPIELGIKRYDKRISEETAKSEREKYPNMKYLGYGCFGVAMDIGDNKVLKYVEQKEAATAAMLQGFKGKYPTVKIYDIIEVQKEINNENVHVTAVWAIITEKLKKLPVNISAQWYRFINKIVKLVENNEEDKLTDDQKDDLILEYADRFHVNQNEAEYYVNEAENLTTLREVGLAYDMHDENVGINSEGRIVLLDLGT